MIGRRQILFSLEDIDLSKRFVIVANHRGMPDPFIIGYSLPFAYNLRLTPWRFFVQNRFFNNPFLLPFLLGFGCFPARKEVDKKSGLGYGIDLLKDGQNLVIFPEGKVSRFDQRILPKTGVEVLAQMQSVLLVPVRVRWNRKRGLIKSYSLSVGKPFNGKNMTAAQIMDVVYSLKFS